MSSATVPEFGPNDWFVEEKYQQFLTDPASVDTIWREYFADNRRAANGAARAAGKAGVPEAEGSTTGTGETAGSPRPASSDTQTPAAPTASAPAIPATPPPPPPPAPRASPKAPAAVSTKAPAAKPAAPAAKPADPGRQGDRCR